MNQISRKLRSQSGATMLIALMFMMFCLFVGGSVLASASANGYRVAHLSDQQDFLNQRSAALLLADEIDGNGDTPTLRITDVVLTETPKVLLPGGGVANDTYTVRTEIKTRSITFTADFTAANPMTVVQKLMFETAVCRYLKENGVTAAQANDTNNITFSGFHYTDPSGNVIQLQSVAEFWYPYDPEAENILGSISITGSQGGNAFTSYNAYFTSSGDAGDLFDFQVTFDNTQMIVSANAYMSRRDISQPGEVQEDTAISATEKAKLPAGCTAVYEVSASTIKSTIKWQSAYIQKGGA